MLPLGLKVKLWKCFTEQSESALQIGSSNKELRLLHFLDVPVFLAVNTRQYNIYDLFFSF